MDGCSSTCFIETGWTCAGGTIATKDTCAEICGDGLNYGTYFCDDGNLVNGDGCSSTCKIETGWTCFGGTPTKADFCWRTISRITNALLSTNNTVITLYFNETVFMSSTFSKDDIFIYISGPRDVYDFTFDVLNIENYKGTNIAFNDMQV